MRSVVAGLLLQFILVSLNVFADYLTAFDPSWDDIEPVFSVIRDVFLFLSIIGIAYMYYCTDVFYWNPPEPPLRQRAE